MDIPLDEVIYVEAIASSSTGAAADADSTPTFAVYEEATDTDIGVGGNMTKRTSLTGDYRASFTASAANGFELGKWYVVIGSATIGAIATKGVLARFRIVAAETTAGYPLTILAPVTHTSAVVPTVSTLTGHTAQTGDSYAIVSSGTHGNAAIYAKVDTEVASILAAVDTEIGTLQTSIDDLPTNAELATALGTADDAVLSAIAGLNNITAASVWAVATRTLTAGTNIQLPSNGLANITAWTVDVTGSLSGSVGSVTTKTGYKLASDGLDLVVPADPSAIPVLGTASIVALIGYFGAWTVNEVNSDSNSVNLRNSADNADLATHATADDGTTFSSSEPT